MLNASQGLGRYEWWLTGPTCEGAAVVIFLVIMVRAMGIVEEVVLKRVWANMVCLSGGVIGGMEKVDS